VAPEISGRSLDGETISLGDFRGRPVVVNVWSSW
jgi:peroxiredoxin